VDDPWFRQKLANFSFDEQGISGKTVFKKMTQRVTFCFSCDVSYDCFFASNYRLILSYFFSAEFDQHENV